MNQYSRSPLSNIQTLSTAAPPPTEISKTIDKVFYGTKITLACLIILTNLLVLFMFQRKKRVLLTSPVNNILCSFTVNDLIAGIAILVLVIPYCMVEDKYVVVKRYIKVFRVGYILSKLCLLSSVGHLVLLSCDRMLAVVLPLTNQIKFTKKCAIICNLFAWTIAIALPLLEYLLHGTNYLKIYTSVIMLCFVLVPLVILLCQHIITFLFIRKNIRQLRQRSIEYKANCKKAFLLQLIMFLSFFICAVPYVSMRIIFAYNRDLFERIPAYLNDLLFLLRFSTSFTNPILFTLYKTDFQNVIKAVFFCREKSKEALELTLLRRTNSLHGSVYSSTRLKQV